MMLRTLAAASVATLMAVAGTALAQDASISVKDQEVKGKKVTIDKVTIPVDGWVVIHPSDAAGKFIEKDIGHAPVKAGTNSDIPVTLTEEVKDGAKLHAMLHEDTGAKGTYEFGKVAKADGPVVKDGKPVIDDFTAK
jgi:hypothetical protein